MIIIVQFSEPHESLIKERDRYKKENIKVSFVTVYYCVY